MNINFFSEDIKNNVFNCLDNKKPLFMLRMGDGEMIIAKNIKDKIKYFSEKQFGRILTEPEIKKCQDNLTQSVLNSTILGLPTKKHCDSNILWCELFNYYFEIKNNNRLSWVDKKYSSINSHYELLNSGCLFEIFNRVNKIVVISPRNITEKLMNRFPNINEVEYYTLPGEQKYEVTKNTDINIVDRIDEISLKLKSKNRSGELLIFGAGPLGKILGSDFYIKGGVALDLGSVFDLFVGKKTRGKGKGPTSMTKPLL